MKTKTKKAKAEQIIDLMTKLAEDEESVGKLNYGDDPVTGHLRVTIDGRRVHLYLDPLPPMHREG